MKTTTFLFMTLILCVFSVGCTSNNDLEDRLNMPVGNNNEIFYITKYGYVLEKDFIGMTGFGNGITKCVEHNYANGYGCLRFSNDVTVIPRRAFEYCSSLQFIYLPKSVTEIEENAFVECGGLKELDIPDCVTRIGSGAFWSCKGLTQMVIPNNVAEIEDYTFTNCTGLLNIELPNSLTSIGDFAFFGCEGITNVVIPDSVTYIGCESFRECVGLSNITIPSEVTKIGMGAFYGCDNLTDIYCFAINPPSFYYNYNVQNRRPFPESANIYVPKESIELYKSAEVWDCYPNIMAIEDME